MMDNGKEMFGKDMEFKFGLMEQNMKDIGKMVKLMDKVCSH